MRKTTLFSAIGAAVLVAAAATTRLVVLPALDQLPADLDTSVHYSGTATVVNTAALQSGDMANALRTNVPITLLEHVKTVSTRGETAVVSDEITLTGSDNTLLQRALHSWSVNRRTLAEAPTPTGASGVSAHEGLVFGFPLSPEAHDYPYWDYPTQTTTTASYERTEKHAGRNTYVYTVHASGPVKDSDILAALPPALPKATLLGLAATLAPALQQSLASSAALLPDQLPLAFTSTIDITFWVDTKTGSVLDVTEKQSIAAAITVGSASVPLATVFAVDAKFTPDTVSTNSDDAATAQRGLLLVGTVAPAVLLLLGLLLAVLAVWSARRRRNGTQGQPPASDPGTGPVTNRAAVGADSPAADQP
jgi:hypothetical protein